MKEDDELKETIKNYLNSAKKKRSTPSVLSVTVAIVFMAWLWFILATGFTWLTLTALRFWGGLFA